jgi:amino-acid N-acetyltransferase
LIYVTEVKGIPLDSTDPQSDIDCELTLADAEKLLASLPNPKQPTDTAFYLQHAIKASKSGVDRVHIVPFSVDGSVLIESFTHDGVGTMIVDEKLESLREATADDLGGVLQLIEPFENDGTLVKRDRTEIERDIDFYTVIEHDGVIFGCAALYPYPEKKTGEMAALTVSESVQGQGDGERILKRIEQRARAQGLTSIFVLTTRTMHWFVKRGFEPASPDWLPEARQKKYNWNRRSQVLVKPLV